MTTTAAALTAQRAATLDPIVYTIRVPAPERHIAEISAAVPTGKRSSIDLMLPVWSPGFYRLADYAKNVQEFAARTTDGKDLAVDKSSPNHWQVATNGAATVVISYKLLCESQFVTGCWIGPDSAVINGPSTNQTISYYDKGPIVGLLLDARIRRATNDAKSLDDVMRLAIKRYSGERGFKPEEFQATASEVAGVDLSGFFHKTLATTEELDYVEALDWFGLRFVDPASTDPARAWALEPRSDATDAQKRHFQRLLSSGGK